MGESRTILSLASILSFRMLGLFMIYPVFAIYAPQFTHANPTLIGIALGIYGLTQAILQLPLSTLSDRIGRKPVIMGGLLIFALGSIISALTHNIYLLIMGRALQGAGAIGSTLMACAVDVTSHENRVRAMAILGITIGVSFALAMVIGPVINGWFHLSGIFWLTAIFALLGILITHFFIPTPQQYPSLHKPTSFIKTIRGLLIQKELLTLNVSIFLLHALFTASFIVVPLLFKDLGLESHSQWKVYLPLLIGSLFITLPILMISEKKHLIKQVMLSGIITLAISEFIFYHYPPTLTLTLTALFVFFVGFTLLEALLPSLISKCAPYHHKGSAMGIYSTFQFLGIFAGGFIAGCIRSHYDNIFIFYYCLLLCIVWFAYMLFMKPPAVLKTEVFHLNEQLRPQQEPYLIQQLMKIPGVFDARISLKDGIAYLKVDNRILDKQLLINFFAEKA